MIKTHLISHVLIYSLWIQLGKFNDISSITQYVFTDNLIVIQIGLILLRALNSDLAALSSTLNLCQRKSFALVTQVGVYQKINPLSSTKCLFNLVIFNMSLSQRFSVSHHLSDFHCLTISVIFTVSPLQRFSASHLLSEFSCPMT